MAERDNTILPGGIGFSPYHMYIYMKAIRQGTEKDRTIRVNIVGNYNQGKTCLTRRLIGKSCNDIESTNGIDINCFRCTLLNHGKRKLAEIEDKRQDYINRIACLARSVPVKLSTPSALEQASPGPTNYSPTANKNTSMQKPTTLSPEEYKSFEAEVDEGSDRGDVFLDFWDFGGQYTFYATHTLFHSRKAVYLLVFDLSLPLDKQVKDEELPGEDDEKSMEYYARFWMESIHYFLGPGPQVVLIGTHTDKLDGDDEEKREAKDKYFHQIRSLFVNTDMIDHIQPEDFAVSNHDSPDDKFEEILEMILQKGLASGNTYEIPGRWVILERNLNKEKHQKIIEFSLLRKINEENEIPLKNDDELKLFLQYHHEKRTLFYFDEEPIRNHVVLDPRYVINAFRCIITTDRYRLKDPRILNDWDSLSTEGILTNQLIDQVWAENFLQHKSLLLEFLRKHLIVSRVVEYNETTGDCTDKDWYVIPSLL